MLNSVPPIGQKLRLVFMNKILVTGAAGNIGGAMVKKLLQKGSYFVVAADDLSTGKIEKLPPSDTQHFKFVKCNVNNLSELGQVMLAHQFDFVFHLAAKVGVQRTQEDPVGVLRDIEGIRNILELSKNTSVKRVFYASSSEVYGEPVTVPQHEHTTPLNSRVPYAVVKNVGECFCRSYQFEYGLNYTIFRYFNTYGPSQSTDFVLPRFIEAALKEKPIQIYGDGSQSRTFTYVDDTVDASLGCLFQNQVLNEVINIGNDQPVSILELAKMILRITGSPSVISHMPPLQDGDMTRRQPDNTKMQGLLNRPLIPLEEGILRTLRDPGFLKSIGV